MKIQNSKKLARSEARKAALEIAEAGLEAIDTETVVKRAVRLSGSTLSVGGESFTLSPDGKLIVIGVGKCSLEAGKALESILGKRITSGIIVTPDTSRELSPYGRSPEGGEIGNLPVRQAGLKLEIRFGTHPFPTQANVKATKEIIQILSGLSERDTVLFIISGGGSTLLCLPAIASAAAGQPVRSRAEEGQPQNFTCEDEANVMRRLFEVGANIEEINTLRKHTSLARGGWLAQYTYPAQVISLIFSDVPGAALSSIASGPTVKDETTAADAKKVLDKYDIRAKCNLQKLEPLETPKEEKYFKRVSNILLVSNEVALEVMFHKAQALGFTPHVRTSALQGEAKEVGEAIASDLARQQPMTALLYGGETTVVLWNPKGKGGRDLELLLAALPGLNPDELILAFASDGRDNTDFAGGISDIMTKEHAEKLKFDAAQFLADNDSYRFFQKTGDAVITGNTGSNVSDLIIALKN